MKNSRRHRELETIVVLMLALIVFYWRYKTPAFLLPAFMIGTIGILVPAFGSIIHNLWIKLGEMLGFIMNKVFLAIVFIIIVIPLGWIAGKRGKSSVKLKAGGTSYFKDRNHLFTEEDMEHPW